MLSTKKVIVSLLTDLILTFAMGEDLLSMRILPMPLYALRKAFEAY